MELNLRVKEVMVRNPGWDARFPEDCFKLDQMLSSRLIYNRFQTFSKEVSDLDLGRKERVRSSRLGVVAEPSAIGSKSQPNQYFQESHSDLMKLYIDLF